MTVEMTKAHFDNTLETVLAVAVGGIVFCAMWIILILVDIEASKVSFFSVNASGKDMDLQLDVTTEDANTASSGGNHDNGMEVEPEPRPNATNETVIKAKRGRRVSCHFKMMQIGSVGLLILLTYLLLVASNASGLLSALGALAVFGMFLRFQIGDEMRRQRWDRMLLLVSLFLLIASFLNLSTYAWKSLAQGEIYMGPARIIGYDMSAYSNTTTNITTHANTTIDTARTNLIVQWGSDWGCPYSGGKVCEADIHGVMCAARQKDGNRRRRMANNQGSGNGNGNGSGSPNHHPNQSGNNGNGPHHGNGTPNGNHNTTNDNNNEEVKLEKENQDLEKENEELKQEIEELSEKNDEEVDEMYDGEEAIEEEVCGTFNFCRFPFLHRFLNYLLLLLLFICLLCT